MTALLALVLSFLMTLSDQGSGPGFIADWLSRLIGTYALVLPSALLVMPLSSRLAEAFLGRLAMSSAAEGPEPPKDPVIHDSTRYWSDQAQRIGGPVMLVNHFTPQPGKADEFVTTQSAEYVRLRGKVDGFVANRLGRAVDGSDRIVNVAVFESIEAYTDWRDSKLFADHMDIIRPLVASASPGIYAVVYDSQADGAA